MATINGGNGNDHLNGTNGSDTINGNGGNDTIDGRGGNDTINGGAGNDTIDGGTGNDTIHGNADNDTIHGGDGNDTIFGDDGDDHLFGDAGIDTISGGNGNDVIDGGTGDDVLHGNAGNDAVSGGDGNDTITGDDGNDFLDGGDGNDTLTGGGGFDLIYGGNGVDTAVYSGAIAEYQFYQLGPLLGVVHNGGAGADGADLLLSVEKLQFSDVTIDLTHNNAPIAVDDVAATNEDAGTYSSGSASVLDNDFDFEHDPLHAVAGSFIGTYGTLNLNSDGTYSYVLNANAQTLAQGQIGTDSFNYTVSDGSLTDTGKLTISITGINDAPVANPDSAAGTENQVLTIDVLANDTDVDNGHVLTVLTASAPAGQGTASVVGNQVRFDPGTDFDHLAAGATQLVTVNYTITDEFGATSSSTVAVTVTGTNDAPVANPDSASGTENQVLSIDVLANDTDVDDGHALTVVSASAPAGQGTASVVGNQVQFDPGTDFDHLAVGETQVVTVSYGIQDEHGAPSSSTMTITVTGTNDAPTIDAGGTTDTGSVTELPNNDPQENVAIHHADGTIAFHDVDTSDVHSASATPQGAGYLGTFTLDPVNQVGDNVAWHFSVSDAALDSLNAGDTLTQVYTIEIDDGHGGTVDQDVTITIHGASDNTPPVAVDDSYNAIGNVTLHVNAAQGVLANDSDDGGVGTGPGQADVTSFDATSANGGTVSMNPDGSFNYTSAAGFTGTDTFTYTLTDAEGATDTATVTVTVGASVWFIDNAALGSANTGTESDPFTSLASFNAAQGTANGPATGELIYLRQGTGSYTEADGINLLDGQTLVGGGENLVVGAQTIETATGRPTIVVTGAGNDGVDVGQNNSLSGFDIGSVTRAGISDSGGTVGTLTVADVGKSGAGQIADIDQGGTLNVTLNNAASTGSTGGAIDLHNVGGSFTVTGATSISGSQTGGGLNASGDTNLAVDFQGGLTASTGAANAVAFTGNAGTSSLAVAGGMALTTTTGTALLVQNGGSVTVTGATNTIATTGGGAVNITNATIGGAGVTLQSASSIGGTNTGIVLDHAGSGGFSVTGTASVAGSGGTISGKTGADGATLQGNGVFIDHTSNVTLDNMAITANANHGILGNDASNITLIDSTLTNNGSASSEGAVVLNNLTGTSSLLGDVIGGSAGDNVHVTTSAGSLNLTIADSANDQAIIGTTNNVTGDDGVHIDTSGSGALSLTVDGVDFQGARGDLLEVQASGNASQSLVITNDNFHNTQATSVGGGVLLDGGGSNIAVDYRIENSSFTGAAASAINASYVTDGGTIRGFINGNTIGNGDGISGNEGSSGGDGITAGIEKTAGAGSANYYLIIQNNDIHDVFQGNGGISLRSAGGGAGNAANLEANVHDNVIDEMGANALAGMYTQIGGTAGSGDFSHLGLQLDNNVIDGSGALLNAVFLDQISSDAHYSFPGYAGSPNGEFFGGTASADLDAFWQAHGNVLTNGQFPSFPGGVDASLIQNADGAPIAPPWYP